MTQQTQNTQASANLATSSLSIAVAQTSFLVGAIEDNAERMATLARQAKDKGADIIVFAELAITGYPPEDLLFRANIGKRVQNALNKLAGDVKDIVMIVGYPHIDHHGCFNSAAILHEGRQRGFYHKKILPNYSVFDEKRYFNEGKNTVCFDYKGQKIGLAICEDVWKKEPIAELKDAGADCVISIHSSPFEVSKQLQRKAILKARVEESSLPILYVNDVGGQDDLVFDGGSMAINADGEFAFELSRFEDHLSLVQFSEGKFNSSKQAGELSKLGEIYYALVVGLRDYVKHSGFKSVILGLSGGIDSALTLCIAADALGAQNVHAVMMPFEYTADMSVEDAKAQAEKLGVHFSILPIHDAYAGITNALNPAFAGTQTGVAEENLQARLRGTMLMALSNKFGHMLLATGNKSELAVGYATLYGDMCGGYAPIKDVYKTDVYALAKYRNSLGDSATIPERVITRAPSAELKPDQTDQDSLPSYDTLDGILRLYIDEQQSIKYMLSQGFDADTVKKVMKMVDANEYKRRQGAPGPKVSHMAFTRERRYPVVNFWLKGLN